MYTILKTSSLLLPKTFTILPSIIFLLVLAVPGLLLAQSDSAQISGFVKDPSGAVVPGAKISITSQTKGSERRATTNGQGYYSVPDLPPDV